MHIVYVSDERYPSTHTDTQQVAMTVDALAQAGAEVTLMVPGMRRLPRVSRSADKSGANESPTQLTAVMEYYGVSSKFSLVSVSSVNPELRTIVKPLHAIVSQLKLSGIAPDVIYTRNIGTAIMSTLRGFSVILESYRVIDRDYMSYLPLWRRISRNPNFLGVICHSRLSADSFVRVGVPAVKVTVIHNGFDISSMKPELNRTTARGLLNWSTAPFIATYSGHLNPNKGVDMLARWAAATPAIHHVWVGGGDHGSTEYAERERNSVGAANVELAGWVPPAQLPPYLYASDVLMIPPTAKPLTRHGSTVLPMKTFAYMASGRAIVAPDLPDIREVLVHERNALLIEPDRLDLAKDALLRLQGDPQLAQDLGRNARTDSLSATWSARANKILGFLETRLGQSDQS